MNFSGNDWWRSDVWREAGKLVAWAFFFVVFMPSLLVQPFRIPSSSMEGTLLVGDYLWVSKFSYGYSKYSFSWFPVAFAGRVWEGAPNRGDVVVFRLPADPSQDFIKRVVGLPGDHVQMIDGVVHVNGEAAKLQRIEDFVETDENGVENHVARYNETLPGTTEAHAILDRGYTRYDDTEEFVVPAGHFFMMGDNRDNSSDSRSALSGVGYVPAENLIGRAQMIFFSRDPSMEWWELWKLPVAMRYSRLFQAIE